MAEHSCKAQGNALWQRLRSYEVGPAEAEFTFTQRIARENRWEIGFAERVISEYRRFVFLAMVAGQEVTPSDQVDQVWHLHLTYTRDYWQRFCPDILGGELHHGPTRGGEADRSRFHEQYAQTLKLYEEWFGEPAPVDIWSPAARRFVIDPQAFRVNPHDVTVLPRRVAIAIALAAAVALMAAIWVGMLG